jgi:hypothetical protein
VLIAHNLCPQALQLPENQKVREQLHATVDRLRQLPRVIAPPPPPGMNGNGNGASNGNGTVPEGPAALLALCRDLAMQIKVSLLLTACTVQQYTRVLLLSVTVVEAHRTPPNGSRLCFFNLHST